MIDAEESWMQDEVDDLLESLMKAYNTEKPIVYSTLQLYRWDRFEYLKSLHERAKNEDYKLGFKIVRGAYMEKERERAEKYNYKSPICKDKDASDENFDQTLAYIIENLKDISLFIGTHNEESSYLAMKLMEEKGIAIMIIACGLDNYMA